MAIHELIESGCVVSSSEFWNVLKHVLEGKWISKKKVWIANAM
jgi:hypothetical protein